MGSKISKTGTRRLSKRERISIWRLKEAAREKAKTNSPKTSSQVQSERVYKK